MCMNLLQGVRNITEEDWGHEVISLHSLNCNWFLTTKLLCKKRINKYIHSTLSLGSIRHQVFSESLASGQLEIINEYIQTSEGTNFTGKWALLVEWSGVHPYNHQSFINSPSSFERDTADFLNSVSMHAHAWDYT